MNEIVHHENRRPGAIRDSARRVTVSAVIRWDGDPGTMVRR
jgi:hypothetical protein